MSGTSRWHRTKRAISRQAATARVGMQILDQPKPMTALEQRSAIMLAIVVAEAIRTAGQIPSGTVYAMMMGQMSLVYYEALIDHLVRCGLIRKDDSRLLTWIGPTLPDPNENFTAGRRSPLMAPAGGHDLEPEGLHPLKAAKLPAVNAIRQCPAPGRSTP